jgi:hypothetical protein
LWLCPAFWSGMYSEWEIITNGVCTLLNQFQTCLLCRLTMAWTKVKQSGVP